MTGPEKSRARHAAGYGAGHSAETLAAWFLRLKGYRILARRYRSPRGEIDLIAVRRGLVVAVEVKYRPDEAAGRHAIGLRQRQRIAAATEDWCARTGHGQHGVRFDAVIILPGRGWAGGWRWPRHIVDAWRL